MAYVIWRVIMKKYSRVRLGLHGPTVTPTGRHALTFDEESWKSTPDDDTKDIKNVNSETTSQDSEFSRSSEIRQSKAKRVKNYLKKCKSALSNTKSNNTNASSSTSKSNSESVGTSLWYLESIINQSEVNELEEVFEDAQSISLNTSQVVYQKANIIEGVKVPDPPTEDLKEITEDCEERNKNATEIAKETDTEQKEFNQTDKSVVNFSQSSQTSPPLMKEQEKDDGNTVIEENKPSKHMMNNIGPVKLVKSDVERLVDEYFSNLYKNYQHSRKCLIRQARDLLVCEYHGCLQRFEKDFCIPAQILLQHLRDEHPSDLSSPSGWPLCLGESGVIIHLSPLNPSVLRNRDCYLCIRNRSAPGLEIALIWKQNHQIYCHTIAEFRNPIQNLDVIMCSSIRSITDLELNSYDDYDGTELPELLQNLLVSVEHAIKRVPLDDLSFPCPQCMQCVPVDSDRDDNEADVSCSCQCSCRYNNQSPVVKKKDTSIQTSPMFDFVGSIPHIDSDEEEEKELIKSGSANKKVEIVRPKRISELPDKLLMSGINLPGTYDTDGRPIILCYAECIARAGLNKYEVAKLLYYYSSIPTVDSLAKGFTILLLAENESDIKVLELLDKTICLISNTINVNRFLIWRPAAKYTESKILASRVQAIFVNNEEQIKKFLDKDQTPVSCCGGGSNHDQLEWVQFFKQYEPFLSACQSAGKSLLTTLSQLRDEEVPHQVTRRFLNHQLRQITKALEADDIQKLNREGSKTITKLKERGQCLSSSKDVKRSVSFACSSFNAVDRVTKRLKQLEMERNERLKEWQRFRTLQKEAEEFLTWIKKDGEETLNKITLHLRSATDAATVKDVGNDFEKFFFKSWKQIDKSNDLVEDCNKISDPKGQSLKEIATELGMQMKLFKDKLEETRERLEDTSRCFQLIETSGQDLLEEDNIKDLEDFKKLAEKTGNIKLLQTLTSIKKAISTKPPDKDPDKLIATSELFTTSTPIKSKAAKRSQSTYIYHCIHHTNGEICTCFESDGDNSLYKSKKKYTITCTCGNRDGLERKNNGSILGDIKEERESVENLLKKVEAEENDCRRCDSGLSSTADNSIGCGHCAGGSSSADSNPDHTDNQQDSIIEEGSDCFIKSDDNEEDHYAEENRKVPPVSSNKHLYCHASNLDLPSDALYNNMDTKTQKTLKYIIIEMIETERDYVKSLEYIIENYLPELQREDIPQALRGQRNTVFGNVEKLYEFHSQYFLTELEQCESNPLQVGQIFLRYKDRFYLYALYNKNKPKSDSLMSEYGNFFFKTKQLELGDKMDLASYLLKPVQRMGKYALLLQQMMKACPKLEELVKAEEMVRFQLRHGNDLLAMDSIRDCDVNLKEQGKLLRQNEFLVWEGRSGKKSLRQVFLFDDLILFSKAKKLPDKNNLDLYYYKNSIKMTDIGFTPLNDSPTKFEIWFRKRKPNDTFTLQSSEDVKKAWILELNNLLWKQALKSKEIRIAEMSSMGIGNKPCLDIRPSQDQINDRSITVAQLSKTPRFRNSIVVSTNEACHNVKRPHSVISMSSVSSSSTSSGGSGTGTNSHHMHLTQNSFESDNQKPYHRSATLNSQCSVESGIIADMSVGSDEFSEQNQP